MNGSDEEDEGGVAASAMIEDEEDVIVVPQETGEQTNENDEALMNMMAPDSYQRRL